METQVIKYNLKERGRKFRGRDRHFNIDAIVRAINSPACQERVKKRDMLGFYGHWPRQKFGIYPMEGGLESGKPAIVEPALVTTYLKAYPDGTVEHRAEFLDTDSGKIAARLFGNRVGGFSSAIDISGPDFYGFDYVLEPNYSTNRGWALDGAEMSEEDAEAAIRNEQLAGVMELVKHYEAALDSASATIERMEAENAELMSLVSTGRDTNSLDSVAGTFGGRSGVDRMNADRKFFNSIRLRDLPEFEKEEGEEIHTESPIESSPFYRRVLAGR